MNKRCEHRIEQLPPFPSAAPSATAFSAAPSATDHIVSLMKRKEETSTYEGTPHEVKERNIARIERFAGVKFDNLGLFVFVGWGEVERDTSGQLQFREQQNRQT
eukprot:5368510-Amphidinium_carterae.1